MIPKKGTGKQEGLHKTIMHHVTSFIAEKFTPVTVFQLMFQKTARKGFLSFNRCQNRQCDPSNGSSEPPL